MYIIEKNRFQFVFGDSTDEQKAACDCCSYSGFARETDTDNAEGNNKGAAVPAAAALSVGAMTLAAAALAEL